MTAEEDLKVTVEGARESKENFYTQRKRDDAWEWSWKRIIYISFAGSSAMQCQFAYFFFQIHALFKKINVVNCAYGISVLLSFSTK